MVEINGSTHFYDTTEHRLPKYNLKDSLFKAAGINCLNIDYHRYLDENKEIKSDQLIKDIKDRLSDGR